jgi:hypothetical protein
VYLRVGGLAATREENLAAARRAHAEAAERAEPYVRPLRDAERELLQAERELWAARRAAEQGPVMRRRSLTRAASQIEVGIGPLRARVGGLEEAAAPYIAEVEHAEACVRSAEHDVTAVR